MPRRKTTAPDAPAWIRAPELLAAMHDAAQQPALSDLDDGALVRQAMGLHLVAGELPRGVPARLARMLGVNPATVCRAGAGGNVQLTAEARKALEAHVVDPEGHPLPGSELRGRPRADAPPPNPDRRHSRGGARRGKLPKEGASVPGAWLTPDEEAVVRELADQRGVVPGKVVADAMVAYAESPDASPPSPPEGARQRLWMTGAGPVAILDAAIGGARGRREHVRAAILRVLVAAKKKQR